LEDYDKIKDYCWLEHKGYICSKSNNQFIAIHQLILGKNNQKEIDHVCSENKFDNRKSNLRFITHLDNMCNKKHHPIINLVSKVHIGIKLTKHG